MTTTLIEELEQAAEDADLLAFGAEKQFYATRASHRRQRAAWVGELEAKAAKADCLGCCDCDDLRTIRLLTGPIPSETAVWTEEEIARAKILADGYRDIFPDPETAPVTKVAGICRGCNSTLSHCTCPTVPAPSETAPAPKEGTVRCGWKPGGATAGEAPCQTCGGKNSFLCSGCKGAGARKSFPVTDADLDAPDGERIYDPKHGGWFERVGATWKPCDPPAGHLCIDIAGGARR